MLIYVMFFSFFFLLLLLAFHKFVSNYFYICDGSSRSQTGIISLGLFVLFFFL